MADQESEQSDLESTEMVAFIEDGGPEDYFDAGELSDLDKTPDLFNKVEHDADTARKLAIIITAMFGGSFFLHYIAT